MKDNSATSLIKRLEALGGSADAAHSPGMKELRSITPVPGFTLALLDEILVVLTEPPPKRGRRPGDSQLAELARRAARMVQRGATVDDAVRSAEKHGWLTTKEKRRSFRILLNSRLRDQRDPTAEAKAQQPRKFRFITRFEGPDEETN